MVDIPNSQIAIDDKWVRIPSDVLPPTFDPTNFSKLAQAEFREVSTGKYRVALRETYLKSKVPKFELELLARGTSFEPTCANFLGRLPSIDKGMQRDEREWMIQARRFIQSQSEIPEPLWSRFSGEVQLVEDDQLLPLLSQIQSEGESGDSLLALAANECLSMRLAMMRAMFAQRHTKEAWKSMSEFVGFPAAKSLMSGSSNTFLPFFVPPLLLQSPWIWGTTVVRPGVTFLRMFEHPLMTRSQSDLNPMETFRSSMYDGPRLPRPVLPPTEGLEQREAFVHWWVDGASHLIHILGDFTRYRDRADEYSPSEHVAMVLSIERLFTIAIEIMKSRVENPVLRKWLLFDFLDVLEGLHVSDIEQSLSLKRRAESWQHLKIALPPVISDLLGGIIESALTGLEELDSSMWATSQLEVGGLRIIKSDGTSAEVIATDRVRGEYLRIVRNSQHGFKNILNNPRKLNYLASFTGELSNDIPDVIWCFLVDLISDPEAFLFKSQRPRN